MRAMVCLAMAVLAAGCGSKPAAPEQQKPAASAPEAAPKKESVPTDLPIPSSLTGRHDSTLPGTKWHVVQGEIPLPMHEAIAAVRQAAQTNGWKESGAITAPETPTVTTLPFEKEGREAKATLARVDATKTSLNLMTGPKPETK